MADSSVSIDQLKAIWHSQVHDEEKWALNMVLLSLSLSLSLEHTQIY
jgi:hypothetical protein